MPLNLAIDGPVGAGKSSIADAVAARLGILHLDTGAMYRAVGLAALRAGLNPAEEDAVTALCRRLRLDVRYEGGRQRTLLDGEDVSGLIRTEEVSMAASAVARHAGVRQAMVALQQSLAATRDMLLDGRDIGTRVLPQANVKIYLTASAEARARRRYLELARRGASDTYDQVLADLRRRDDQDMHRAVDPLRPAEDAQVVDTTDMTFDQVVEAILQIVEAKQHEGT